MEEEEEQTVISMFNGLNREFEFIFEFKFEVEDPEWESMLFCGIKFGFKLSLLFKLDRFIALLFDITEIKVLLI